MINHYTDHAANERTYLAWIRTAITIMAFGFLIEKFDLFVAYLGEKSGADALRSSPVAEWVGLGLFALGALIVLGATRRFFVHKTNIDTPEVMPYGARRGNLLLSALMVLLAVFLLVYLIHQLA